MIPKDCKRLIEVDFPIAKVSTYSVQEKSIRHGHPSTLHLWWARRPLAACRAVLLGLLLPDPCDPNCPQEFKETAKRNIGTLLQCPGDDYELREALLAFIADFADWDKANNPTYLRVGRELIRAAHPEETPLIVDPFSGGGSIPYEAMRLGVDVFASDLNPVSCLILKTMLDDIPRHGQSLYEDLGKISEDIKTRARKELAQYYPQDSDGVTPIAFLWARTIKCEATDCGAEIPLMRTFWLAKKKKRKIALRFTEVEKETAMKDSLHCFWGKKTKALKLEIFTPSRDDEVVGPTVSRAKATCPCCGRSLSPTRVRDQLASNRGGADVVFDSKGNRIGGAILLAVATLKEGQTGRLYRLSTNNDYIPVFKAVKTMGKLTKEKMACGLMVIPDEDTPSGGGSGAGRAFSLHKYGMNTWGDLFSARQKIGLITLARIISDISGDETRQLAAMVCTKLADRNNALVNWSVGVECPNQLFKGSSIPMGWDFSDSNLLSDSSASISQGIENLIDNVAASIIPNAKPTSPQIADACSSPLPDQTASVWFTDPPYYDAVPYSDLSDLFYVWFRRALPNHPLLLDPFDGKNNLTPKMQEIVQDDARQVCGIPKDNIFFENAMSRAFEEGRRVLKEDGIGCVVFAHKTTEGWEALLSGMIKGGWLITCSWPIATERYSRVRARNSAALATSVHLICRPRPDNAPVGEWNNVLQELPKRVGDWMDRLHAEGIRGADLVFACIGPSLELYSRYCRVETADGRTIGLSEYLSKVWEVVGRKALENVLGNGGARGKTGDIRVLEEDARLTALFLWTFQTTDSSIDPLEDEDDLIGDGEEDESDEDKKKGGYSLVFDVVRRFSQPLGIDLPKWEGRIINIQKGVVRLLPIRERAKQLFGDERAQTMAERIEDRPRGSVQLTLFTEGGVKPPEVKGRGRKIKADRINETIQSNYEATTLDKVHAAMLLQDSGKTNALRALIDAEQQKGPEFMRLANALSALYPPKSEEKRLLDAMLLSAPR